MVSSFCQGTFLCHLDRQWSQFSVMAHFCATVTGDGLNFLSAHFCATMTGNDLNFLSQHIFMPPWQAMFSIFCHDTFLCHNDRQWSQFFGTFFSATMRGNVLNFLSHTFYATMTSNELKCLSWYILCHYDGQLSKFSVMAHFMSPWWAMI